VKAKPTKAARRGAERKRVAAVIRKERAYIKRRDADRAARGFGPGTDPEDFSLDLAIEARVRPFITAATEAFNASKDTAKSVEAIGADLRSLLEGVRAELVQHRSRLYVLEEGHGAHAIRLDDHHVRISALEEHIKKGPKP
jgi:hypothetical protein